MLQAPVKPDTSYFATHILPTNPEDFWTMVGALAGIVVLVVAYRGLKSLKLTQDALKLTRDDLKLTQTDIETRSQREALQFAIERANLMRTELFPMYAELLDALRTDKVPMFVNKGADVSFTETEEKAKIDNARAWIAALTQERQNQVLALANALEIWAMPFTNGLADPEKAFEPCSSGFCAMVITLYPHLVFQRRLNTVSSGPFQNVVKLFMAWQGQKEVTRHLLSAQRWQAEGVTLPTVVGTNLDKKK